MLCSRFRQPCRRLIDDRVGLGWSIRQSSTSATSRVTDLLHRNVRGKSPARQVTVNGYVRSIRKQKRIAFAHIDDGTSIEPLQAVLTPDQAQGLTNGSAVTLHGSWQVSQGATAGAQSHELAVQEIVIAGENDAEAYPIQKKYQTPEFLRTLSHLRCRLPTNALLLRLRSEMTRCAVNYFSEQGYLQTHPPILTSSDCEGGGEVFNIATLSEPNPNVDSKMEPAQKPDIVTYFRSPKYLTVSSQLHLEALAQSVNKVWALSPTFRAEKSDTARHLSEFYMLEAELTFTKNLEEVMDVVEGLLRSMASHIFNSQLGKDILQAREPTRGNEEHEDTVSRSRLEERWANMLKPWPRITYRSAIDTLKSAVQDGKASFAFDPTEAAGLQAEHEKYLAATAGDGSPVFVTDYPRDQKAFYMLPSEGGQDQTASTPTVACFDLLVPDLCEIVGGSLREHRLEPLLTNMLRHGIIDGVQAQTLRGGEASGDAVQSSLKWYVDLRRFGSVPHGGFGLGFDRLLCYLAGVPNVRDVVAFPRWYGRCDT